MNCNGNHNRIRVAATLCTLVAVTASTAAPDQPRPAPPGPDSSVLIVPVALGQTTSRDVADALGMMLEQAGMPHVLTTDKAFTSSEQGDLPTRAAAFGTWAAGQNFASDWVVLAEIDVIGNALDETRIVLAHRSGRVQWTDRQTNADRAFRKAKPTNPMACCMFLAERLQPQFHLTSAHRGRVKDGPMARRWAEKSGTPSEAEQAAMPERLAKLKRAMADTTVTVYPVQTNLEGEARWTVDLAGQIGKALPLKATEAASALDLEIAPNSNEQRRLWDLARAFRTHLRANPPDAPYALVAEYTFVPTDKQVWTVHVVICDRAGEWVLVDFQNNHHADFNAVQPKTASDCAALVVRRLRGHLK